MSTFNFQPLEMAKRKSLPYGYNSLAFPEDLYNNDRHGGNFMVFYINEQKEIPGVSSRQVKRITDRKTGVTENREVTANNTNLNTRRINRTTVTTKSIAMYIPDSMKINNKVAWENVDLGAIVGIIGQSGMTNGSVYDVASRLKDAYLNPEQLVRSGIQAAPAVIGAIGQLIGNSGISSATQGLGAALQGQAENLVNAYNSAKGVAFNPFKEVLFKGVDFREFSFTYKLYPRTRKESEDINTIVELFRYHMHPEEKIDQAGRFFILPSDFDIEFYTMVENKDKVDLLNPAAGFENLQVDMDSLYTVKENKYLMSMSTCILTGVDINYTPSNVFVTHDNGSPLGVELTLNFRETEIMTKNRIRELSEKKFKIKDVG